MGQYCVGANSSATKGNSDTLEKRNHIATHRACVEHVFRALAQIGGQVVRCMAIVRITFALHLKAASYNLKRLVYEDGGLAPF